MVYEYLDPVVQDGKAITDEISELQSLRNALLLLSFTLKEQLRYVSTIIEYGVEMALNEMEIQLQQKSHELSVHVPTNEITASNDSLEHERRQKTWNGREDGYVTLTDDEQQPELPESSCLRPTDEHTVQLESSPGKKQFRIDRQTESGVKPRNVRESQLHSIKGRTHTSNQRSDGTPSDADVGHNHQLQEVLPHPRATNPVDNSKESELRRKKKMHSCPDCSKRFNNKGNLTVHLKMHSGERPFKCLICNAAFSQKNNLTRHEMIHSGEKPFKCLICSATFSQKDNLKKHQRIHSGEKPFKCLICNTAFRHQSSLSRHQRAHSGEKPFKCLICNAAFFQSGNLTKHKRIHSRDTPFKCLICNAGFNNESFLTRHQTIYSDECSVLLSVEKTS